MSPVQEFWAPIQYLLYFNLNKLYQSPPLQMNLKLLWTPFSLQPHLVRLWWVFDQHLNWRIWYWPSIFLRSVIFLYFPQSPQPFHVVPLFSVKVTRTEPRTVMPRDLMCQLPPPPVQFWLLARARLDVIKVLRTARSFIMIHKFFHICVSKCITI